MHASVVALDAMLKERRLRLADLLDDRAGFRPPGDAPESVRALAGWSRQKIVDCWTAPSLASDVELVFEMGFTLCCNNADDAGYVTYWADASASNMSCILTDALIDEFGDGVVNGLCVCVDTSCLDAAQGGDYGKGSECSEGCVLDFRGTLHLDLTGAGDEMLTEILDYLRGQIGDGACENGCPCGEDGVLLFGHGL
jgi:hypothetical protein